MKLQCSNDSIKKAIKIIKDGGIVVFPTDTVYGIGCDPYNKKAVDRIYGTKERDRRKHLPLLAYSKEIVSKISILDNNSKKIIESLWPGPLTVILELRDKKLKESMKLSNKVAVRIPSNRWSLKLLKSCSLVIGTSANLSGQKPIKDPKDLSKDLDYDLVLDGGVIDSLGESTIVEFKNRKLIIHREGVLTRKEFLKLL